MSSLIHVRVLAFASAALVVTTTRGATPPASLPDPAAPAASVPPSNYRPVLAGYRAAPSDVDAMPWRQANDQAAAIGGWRAYAREAQPPQPAASGAAAPAGRGAR